MNLNEVSPPGWGHTKAEKEKTKPNKPKSKIGGSAAAFKKDLDSGKFKGLPGDNTKKEKTASMFKIMWAAKNKGYKPHYKPGTDKKYKKYQKNEEKQITSMQDNDLFGNAYQRSGASWRISKKKKKKKTQSEEAQTRYWKDDPKTKKSWAQFTNSMKKAATNKAQSDKTAVDTAKHGIKFYDKKGSGRIVKGKKIYK